MSQAPSELYYAKTHEWVRREEDGTVTIGITEHAQDALGDVVFVEMPEVGDQIVAGDQAGVVESVKAASDIYAPISGEVLAANEALEDSPETVNSDAFNDGWFFKLRVDDLSELESLMSAEEYEAFCDNED
jgi:glycine cleavage system H protein